MTRRVVIVSLAPIRFAPGVPVDRWRAAMAEDLLDGLNGLTQADAALGYASVDVALADAVSWPSTIRFGTRSGSVAELLAAAGLAGYQQAAVLAPDIPDLPGLLVGKLLRPLTTRACAVAPDLTGPGAAGLAARLPAADWLDGIDLDTVTAAALRRAGGPPPAIATTPGWRRITGADGLETLDSERAPASAALASRTG
jgi:hypothetical protein